MMHRTSIMLATVILSGSATAQVMRQTEMEVTPEGVFPKTRLVQPQPIPISGNPNPSDPGVVWDYQNLPGAPWISEFVSIGNNGTLDWVGQNLNAEALSLLSATAFGPAPTPIYEIPFNGALEVRARAADKAPLAALAVRNVQAGPHDLHLFNAFSTTPLSTVQINVHPTQSGFLKTEMSDDGSRVAVGLTDPAGTPLVRVFDTAGGLQPIIDLPGLQNGYRHHDLSGDGNVVLLATHVEDYVYDVNTGTLLFSDNTTVSHDAHAIDFDGDTWGRGGFDVGAWKFDGSQWNRILTFNDPSLGFAVFTACGISADGSTFVTAAYDAFDNDLMRVHCFALGTTSATLLWTYASNGTGGLQDTPQAVHVSDDGRIIAVATWGDGGTAHPEVLVFDRDQGNVPIGGIDTPGSAFDCDVSGDGRFVVGGFKAVHANISGNGGSAVSFRVGGEGQWLEGTPSIGQNINIHIGGNVGDQLLIAASFSLLPSGIPVPLFRGVFELDPSTMFLVPTPLGVMTTNDFVLPATIPNFPVLVGLTFYTQTIHTQVGVKILDNSLCIPITP